MGGGGKAESTSWRGPAGEARHSGVTIQLGEREGKALGVPAQSEERRRSASLSRSAAQATAPLHGATPTGDVTASRAKTRPPAPSAQRRQSKRRRGRRSHGKERGKSASGSAQRLRTLKERSGKECDLKNSRSSPAGRQDHPWTLRHAIVTVRPRRQRRLGEANPRRRVGGIERGAGLPAGVNMLTSATTP